MFEELKTRILEEIPVNSQENLLKALSTSLSRLNKCVDWRRSLGWRCFQEKGHLCICTEFAVLCVLMWPCLWNYLKYYENIKHLSTLCHILCIIDVDSKVSVHGESGLFIYKTCCVWATWAFGQENVRYLLFFRQRDVRTLLKRKIDQSLYLETFESPCTLPLRFLFL